MLRCFSATRSSIYSVFLDQEGPNHCTFRGQGSEEIVIAVSPAPAERNARHRIDLFFDMQISRFFTTLLRWWRHDDTVRHAASIRPSTIHLAP
jgi:hypothetical protein